MALSSEQVLHIARLARVALSPGEVAQYAEQLSNILDHFATLSALDTTDIEPTAHPLPIANIMRADEVTPSLPIDSVLSNAPERENGYFRVRAVLE